MGNAIDLKSLEQQAAAAVESGDPADKQRFLEATGLSPTGFQGMMRSGEYSVVLRAIELHQGGGITASTDAHLGIKNFEIGETQFSAIRTMVPTPHWLLRLDETGQVLQAGTAGISNESVPKMQADIQMLLDRFSKGDVADFRRRMSLPEQPPHKAQAEAHALKEAQAGAAAKAELDQLGGYLVSMYMAQGFLRVPLSEREVDDHGGELGALGMLAEYVSAVHAVELAADDNDFEYGGVFHYEVVEPMGEWLRRHQDSSKSQFLDALKSQVENFFGRDNERDCSVLMQAAAAKLAPDYVVRPMGQQRDDSPAPGM